MQNKELTEKIIGCAYRVYNTLGAGFLESVYEKSLIIELKEAGLAIQSQKPIQVLYKGEIVGDFVEDIIVQGAVILELKSVNKLVTAHEVQLVNYLVATKIDVGLLINFGLSGIEIKRKVRELR